MIEVKIDGNGAACSAKGRSIDILVESTLAVFELCKMLKQSGSDVMVETFTKTLDECFKLGLHRLMMKVDNGSTECVRIDPLELLRQIHEEGDSDAE